MQREHLFFTWQTRQSIETDLQQRIMQPRRIQASIAFWQASKRIKTKSPTIAECERASTKPEPPENTIKHRPQFLSSKERRTRQTVKPPSLYLYLLLVQHLRGTKG